jgi:hypothetical protein
MLIVSLLLLINIIVFIVLITYSISLVRYSMYCKNSILSLLLSPRIIVSLTTSPKRIDNIHLTINSLLNQTIPPDYIIINLPRIFKRNNTKFSKIPNFLITNKKIILNPVEDIGPATKIVPTCKSSFTNDSDIIFSVDDDIYYPPNTLQTFLYYHSKYPDYLLTGSSFMYLSDNNQFYPLKECELLEGFSCVLYKKHFLQDIPLSHFDKKIVPNYYYLADDLILSNFIKSKGISMLSFTDNFSFRKNLNPLEYGLKQDALHKGADNTANTCSQQQHCNVTNYIETIKWLKTYDNYYLKFHEKNLKP